MPSRKRILESCEQHDPFPMASQILGKMVRSLSISSSSLEITLSAALVACRRSTQAEQGVSADAVDWLVWFGIFLRVRVESGAAGHGR